MTTRRQFLTTLAGLAAAPFAARALSKADLPPRVEDFTVNGSPGQPGTLVLPGCATREQALRAGRWVRQLEVKVPSNRVVYYDYVSTGGAEPFLIRYEGEWDGRFKTDPDCNNPAYLWAAMMEREGIQPDWDELYRWGVYCDSPVDEVGQ